MIKAAKHFFCIFAGMICELFRTSNKLKEMSLMQQRCDTDLFIMYVNVMTSGRGY